MSRVLTVALVVATVSALPAQASTKFRTTWKASEVSRLELDEGQKVLVMVMSAREESRNGIEALLVQELARRGIEAVPAYAVIPNSAVQDKDQARPYIEKTGARYALVMRVAGREKELRGSGPDYTAVPVYTGPYYGGFYGGYYTFGWGMAYSAGNLQIDEVVHVETLVYDLRTDDLIWAGMSDTMNPDTAQKVVKDLIKEVGKEMKKQGLVRK
jgi:tRNA-dihydrouridine synthase